MTTLSVSRGAVVALLLSGAALGVAAQALDTQHPAPRRAIVVAELFTSEGCSSCPPADAVLRQLVEQQPIPGVQVIALSEHVDYWNSLGWRDPFSSAQMSQRQSAYGLLSRSGIYTPQLVVDGRDECVGSDGREVRRILAAAAKRQKLDVSVARAGQNDGSVQVQVRVSGTSALASHGAADVIVAMIEDHVVSSVTRGENGGRTLIHSSVVRSIQTAGELAKGNLAFTADLRVNTESGWKKADTRVVAFVQERASRTILGGGVD